jgi:hypothetical protein
MERAARQRPGVAQTRPAPADRLVTRLSFFLSSFAPLLGIFALRASKENLWLTITLVAVMVAVTLLLVGAMQVRSTVTLQSLVVRDPSDESPQIPTYLLTYLFPFIFASTNGWQDVAAYAVFAALLALLLWQSDAALINPLLLAVGFRLYVFSRGNERVIIVSRKRLSDGSRVLAYQLSPNAYRFQSFAPEGD